MEVDWILEYQKKNLEVDWILFFGYLNTSSHTQYI